MAGKDFVIEDGVLKKYKGRDEHVVIPKGVTSIGDKAFYDCSDMLSIVIPDYLLTNTPNSGTAKNKKAESLGVKKITEDEFNEMIGRHPQ